MQCQYKKGIVHGSYYTCDPCIRIACSSVVVARSCSKCITLKYFTTWCTSLQLIYIYIYIRMALIGIGIGTFTPLGVFALVYISMFLITHCISRQNLTMARLQLEKMIYYGFSKCSIINPGTCARVMVVVLCVILPVCLSVIMLPAT